MDQRNHILLIDSLKTNLTYYRERFLSGFGCNPGWCRIFFFQQACNAFEKWSSIHLTHTFFVSYTLTLINNLTALRLLHYLWRSSSYTLSAETLIHWDDPCGFSLISSTYYSLSLKSKMCRHFTLSLWTFPSSSCPHSAGSVNVGYSTLIWGGVIWG